MNDQSTDIKCPHRCVFALRPAAPAQPDNVTRNVVFQEVLTGIRPPKPVTHETGPVQEVEDITEWLEFDAIEVEDEELIDEDAITEEGPTEEADIRRRVEARKRKPSQPQQRPKVRLDLPAQENIPSRLDYGPLSEYERIRDCIVEERDQLFLETFGFPLNQRHAVIGQLLGQEEGDSDDSEEEQVKYMLHRLSTEE